ncbi:MAG TPA: Hpt domain-containing protein [Xanthobacteraceae bacterium]|nr:Hpt domain-containing protein [Xanthobacteraceae bacterium]
MENAIDREHLDAATFGDRALRSEVLRLFQAQVRILTAAIRDANGKPRMDAAHTLKGAARGIGAFALADAAEAIERGDEAALAQLETLAMQASKDAEALAS